jgi:hypothetical protein
MKSLYDLKIHVHTGTQVLLIIFALPFTAGFFVFVFFIARGNMDLIIPSIIFAGLSYIAWTNVFSSILINEKFIKVKVFYGIFQMYWDEVENITMNDVLIVFSGRDKRVVLSLAFVNRDQEKLLNLISQESQNRKINLEKTNLRLPITHRNSRVWK